MSFVRAMTSYIYITIMNKLFYLDKAKIIPKESMTLYEAISTHSLPCKRGIEKKNCSIIIHMWNCGPSNDQQDNRWKYRKKISITRLSWIHRVSSRTTDSSTTDATLALNADDCWLWIRMSRTQRYTGRNDSLCDMIHPRYQLNHKDLFGNL